MTFLLPPHISYSQANSHLQCPRSWYLGKVRHAQERMTWYIPIGTAVHNMVEDWLNPEVHFTGRDSVSAEQYFYPLISKQMLIEPDLSQWLSGGSKSDPCVEDKALQKVKDCFERALGFLEDIDVWEVEYDATGRLPGLEVEVKAFVDIIGEHKKYGPSIVDWKTGRTKPKNAFQLETYAALLPKKFYNITTREPLKFTGLWAMLDPDAAKARPIDLSAVDPAEIGAKYQKIYDSMKSMMIQANKSFNCRFCFHQDNCMENAGVNNRTIYYDRSRHDQPPY